MSIPQHEFKDGELAEISTGEGGFVIICSNRGATGLHRVEYLTDRRTLVFKHESDMRPLDAALDHHFNALLNLAKLLGDKRLERLVVYIAPGVKDAADALTPTTKEAVR